MAPTGKLTDTPCNNYTYLCRATIENNASVLKKNHFFPSPLLQLSDLCKLLLRGALTHPSHQSTSRSCKAGRCITRDHLAETIAFEPVSPGEMSKSTTERWLVNLPLDYISVSSRDCTSVQVKRRSRSILHKPRVKR